MLTTQLRIASLRELRHRLDLPQEKFAAKLGVSVRTINRWENGQVSPSPLAIEKIEAILQTLGNAPAEVTQESPTFGTRGLTNSDRSSAFVEQLFLEK